VSERVFLLATRSAGKLRELRPLFASAGLRVIDLDEAGIPQDAVEDHVEAFDTFEANALAKARWFRLRSGGLPTVADDSGLEVRSLGGAPGVYSRRWSGSDLVGQALDDANNARLLAALDGARDRRARYVCVAALVDDQGELFRRGESEGEILERRADGAHGFGYDPFFHSTELGRPFAQVTAGEKERVSHRGRAFRALLEALRGRA
jgi:XTP/dITP diphosphohydrolase